MSGEWYVCPECFKPSQPSVAITAENSDADGNRGMTVRCIECPWCGHEVCEATNGTYAEIKRLMERER